MVYDVSDDLAKFEEYNVDGRVRNLCVGASRPKLLAGEAPDAYKDVSQVVKACEGAGLSSTVARLRPVGVVKG